MNYRFLPFREICNLPRITELPLKLRINSQSLSQSESNNLSRCVIISVYLSLERNVFMGRFNEKHKNLETVLLFAESFDETL